MNRYNVQAPVALDMSTVDIVGDFAARLRWLPKKMLAYINLGLRTEPE